MSSTARPIHFTAAAFADFLVAPDAGEQLSPIEGPGCIVLDLASDASSGSGLGRPSSPPGAAARERLLAALPILPCVTVAVLSEAELAETKRDVNSILPGIASRCDVRVENRNALDRLLRGFESSPIAALSFVQLLRSAPSASIHAGLVAESFVYSTLQAGPEFANWRASWNAQKKNKKRKGASGMGASMERACRLERDRNRLDIHLSRPEKHNAFSRAMRDALCEALQLALVDPSLEEIVLRGEGPSFCSGGDLDEFGSLPDPARAHAIRTTRSPALLLSQLAGRTRSEVHGACIGAGVELPAFTDHVVAEEGAFFALPEIALGLIPGAGGTVSLPRRIGRQRTAWLGLSGAQIDSATALDWGLVDEVRLGQHPGS